MPFVGAPYCGFRHKLVHSEEVRFWEQGYGNSTTTPLTSNIPTLLKVLKQLNNPCNISLNARVSLWLVWQHRTKSWPAHKANLRDWRVWALSQGDGHTLVQPMFHNSSTFTRAVRDVSHSSAKLETPLTAAARLRTHCFDLGVGGAQRQRRVPRCHLHLDPSCHLPLRAGESLVAALPVVSKSCYHLAATAYLWSRRPAQAMQNVTSPSSLRIGTARRLATLTLRIVLRVFYSRIAGLLLDWLSLISRMVRGG